MTLMLRFVLGLLPSAAVSAEALAAKDEVVGSEGGPFADADVCGDQPLKCSPALCGDIAEGTTIHLKAQTYYIDQQIALPKGVKIIGAGIDKTIVKACGPPEGGCPCNYCPDKTGGRRGFLLNSDTYVGKMTMVGKENGRRGMGSAPLETPGCWDGGNTGNAGCGCQGGGDVCNRGKTECKGIRNAMAEHIKVEAFGWSQNMWIPLLPNKEEGNENITFRGIIGLGTWADGANVHGGHKNILFENSHIKCAGDDGFGVWGGFTQSAYQTNITLRNNTFEWCGYPVPSGHHGTICDGAVIGVYGTGKGLTILDNTLISTRTPDTYNAWKVGPISFHGGGWGNYDGVDSMLIQGNVIKQGDGDQNCAEPGSQVCTFDNDLTTLISKVQGGDKGCGKERPPQVAGYKVYEGANCYSGHGGTNIDQDPVAGESAAECAARCTADAKCSCVTHQPGPGNCWKRAACLPAGFDQGTAYNVYMKEGGTTPAPLPAPAPPATPAPAPSPPAPAAWVRNVGRNCYTGNGAVDLEQPAGSSCGTITLEACEAKCGELAACTAVTVSTEAGDAHQCFRRANVTLSHCSHNDDLDTYTRSGAAARAD